MLADEVIARARTFLRSGQPLDAARQLLQLAEQTHPPSEREYEETLSLLANALASAQQPRAAGTVLLYLRRGEEMARVCANFPTDMARAALARARPDARAAGEFYVSAGWPAHAAITYEKAEEWTKARLLWDQVSGNPRLREDPYVAALVSFNMGRVLRKLGDESGAHRCRVRSMRLLEEAADLLEARGMRDRAFDCFQVMLTLGIETQSFENLAEGYLNCVRILKADHLKYYALQYYEDFIRRAELASEHHAVATMLHEEADYARAHGFEFYPTIRSREAQAWQRAAKALIDSGGAAELAENAWLAALGAYSSAGLHEQAAGVFRVLAELPLEEKRIARYRKLAVQFADARNESGDLPPLRQYLQQKVQYPDIWNVDVIEWEEAGDPIETCGEILLDGAQALYVKKKAMLARLSALLPSPSDQPDRTSQIAERLGDIQVWTVLAPLEALYERNKTNVRVAVLRAARKLFFKRTFVLVNRAVQENDVQLRRAALEAISALHFGHAFESLSRLHRDSVDPDVRKAALQSIGKIHSLEAVEYLIGVLTHGSADERAQAREQIERSDANDMKKALDAAIEHATGDVLRVLREVKSRRGER